MEICYPTSMSTSTFSLTKTRHDHFASISASGRDDIFVKKRVSYHIDVFPWRWALCLREQRNLPQCLRRPGTSVHIWPWNMYIYILQKTTRQLTALKRRCREESVFSCNFTVCTMNSVLVLSSSATSAKLYFSSSATSSERERKRENYVELLYAFHVVSKIAKGVMTCIEGNAWWNLLGW